MTFSHADFPAELRVQAEAGIRFEWWWLFQGKNRLRRNFWQDDLRPVHVSVVEEGLLIAYATMFHKTLSHEGEKYQTAGLHAVLTYPSFRRQGYGRRVVDAATTLIRESGTDIAVLFCQPELRRFYAASGWHYHEGARTLVGQAGSAETLEDKPENDKRMMLFVSERGQRERTMLETKPLYFGPATW